MLGRLETEQQEREEKKKSLRNVFTGPKLLDLLLEVFPDHNYE